MTFTYDKVRALDLFAGTGWGVACRDLDIVEDGVDNMPEVIATRQKNQLKTPWHDILDLPPKVAAAYDLLIASPPCQSFSIAGSGEGRHAFEAVLAGVKALQAGQEPIRTTQDPRTWMVLEPLRFAIAGKPPLMAWEQVPNILPLWRACEEVLQEHGYYTWSGLLRTEMYGLSQTRQRAVLLASQVGPVFPPQVTHSRYYEKFPGRRDVDLRPWVPMATALRIENAPYGMALRSNYGTNGVAKNRGIRFLWQPAPTVTTKINRNQWVVQDKSNFRTFHLLNERVTILQAQRLQTYPDDFHFVGGLMNQYLQIGNAVPPRFGKTLISSLLNF